MIDRRTGAGRENHEQTCHIKSETLEDAATVRPSGALGACKGRKRVALVAPLALEKHLRSNMGRPGWRDKGGAYPGDGGGVYSRLAFGWLVREKVSRLQSCRSREPDYRIS